MEMTPLQLEIMRALDLPATRLRWHALTHPDPQLIGRGLVMGLGGAFEGAYFRGGPIASYTVRKLVQAGMVRPVDARNARPFAEGDPPYRDYRLTTKGREACTP